MRNRSNPNAVVTQLPEGGVETHFTNGALTASVESLGVFAMGRTLPGVATIQTRVAATLVKLAFRLGLPDPGDALLETTQRDTGAPRVTPVCDCLEGNTFWIISQRGRDTEWMRNIEANPRVRIKTQTGSRGKWRAGTAHVLDDDDPQARLRILRAGNFWRRLCLSASQLSTTDPLSVRIDLDRPSPRKRAPSRRG